MKPITCFAAALLVLSTGIAANAATTISPMLGEQGADAFLSRRAPPSGKAAGSVPTLTIAIPDSVLSMPSHDPWAHGEPAIASPGDRPDSALASDLIPNDEGYASALQSQVERTRRASVVSAAAAATAALNAAADSAASGPAPVPYARRAPPPSVTLPTLMSFPNEMPVGAGTGIVISGPVAQSTSTLGRVLPYWSAEISPRLTAGETILVAAHGNSLRAIVKLLFGVSGEAIVGVEIPTGNPLVIELDGALKPTAARYLDESRAQALPAL